MSDFPSKIGKCDPKQYDDALRQAESTKTSLETKLTTAQGTVKFCYSNTFGYFLRDLSSQFAAYCKEKDRDSTSLPQDIAKAEEDIRANRADKTACEQGAPPTHVDSLRERRQQESEQRLLGPELWWDLHKNDQ